MLAPLVTFIRDMPLERKILCHRDPPCCGGTHFRKRNRRCALGNTPQGFLGAYSLHLTACRRRRRQNRRQRASRRACRQGRKPMGSLPVPSIPKCRRGWNTLCPTWANPCVPLWMQWSFGGRNIKNRRNKKHQACRVAPTGLMLFAFYIIPKCFNASVIAFSLSSGHCGCLASLDFG